MGETRLEVMETMVLEAVTRELKLVRSMLRVNLPILANIASVAPFIGLFGTVIGIILTFDSIARTGNMGQDLVASGIADALVATAMGLFAAIPAVIAYNFFVDRVNQLILIHRRSGAGTHLFPGAARAAPRRAGCKRRCVAGIVNLYAGAEHQPV